jgi:diguanylate cyclase (GGDEF)-like protein
MFGRFMAANKNVVSIEQKYLTIVSTFAVDLLSMNSVGEIVWHAAKNVVAQLGFDDVVIYIFDEKKQKLIQTATFGNKNLGEYEIYKPIEIELGQGVVGKVALSQQALIINDTSEEPDYIVDDKNRLSELTVPLVVDGRLIGVIDSEHPRKNFYNEEQLNTVVAIASMMATQISRFDTVIQLERVVAKLEHSSKVQDSLFEIAELIFTTDNIDEFYQQLHLSIGRLTFAKNFYIALQSDDKKSIVLPYCADEKDDVVDNERISLETAIPSISGYVLRTNQPLLIYKDQIKQKLKNNELHVLGTLPQAWLGVPFGDELLKGLVVVQSYTDGYIFTEKDKLLLIFVAKHIHNAIERMQTKSELQFLALHDSLTKLPNRLLFTDRVDNAISRVERNQSTSIAVLFLDLDRFKQVNDNHGHYVGDQLLKEVATRINACLRASDTLCRLGGDEFAILLENSSLKAEVECVAANIINAVQQKVLINNAQICISTSIGVTLFNQGKTSSKNLLIQADEAMYRAKLNGRNQVYYYSEQDLEGQLSTYKLERDFLSALEKEELFLVYQPIIDLSTGNIKNAEALVRWQHSQHGLIGPNLFLPELERAGYLPNLDLYVVKQAISFLREHSKSLTSGFSLSINISGQGFSEPALLSLLESYNIKSPQLLNYLCLEITEQTIVDNVEDTKNSIETFRAMGIKIALDDFGTGYSSLSYINQFTFNVLKIDQSFIKNLNQRENNTVILETIIKLSKSLSIKTVAEGIETREQFELLKQFGCDNGQGFYMCKPTSSKDLMQLMLEKTNYS